MNDSPLKRVNVPRNATTTRSHGTITAQGKLAFQQGPLPYIVRPNALYYLHSIVQHLAMTSIVEATTLISNQIATDTSTDWIWVFLSFFISTRINVDHDF